MIKNWRAMLLPGVLGLGALGVASGCGAARATAEEGYQGVVEFDERVLGFEFGGRLREVPSVRGAWVDRGALLASLDPTLTRMASELRASEVEAASAQLALLQKGARGEEIRAMDAQVRAARASEELLEKSLAREQALLSRGASTEAAVEDLAGRLARSRAEREALGQRLAALQRGSRREELAAAEARLAGARTALGLESERLGRHALIAPLPGKVLDVHATAGEVVAAGAPVVTVADTRRPYADVFVPEPRVAALREGGHATVRVDGLGDAAVGRIETIARKAEFTPRFLFSERERPNLVVRVRVRLEDPDERLHAGLPARVVFAEGSAP